MFKLNSILDEETRKALSLSAEAIKNREKYIESEGYTHKRLFLYALIEFSRSLVVLLSGGRCVGDFGSWMELSAYFDEKDRQERLSKENAD